MQMPKHHFNDSLRSSGKCIDDWVTSLPFNDLLLLEMRLNTYLNIEFVVCPKSEYLDVVNWITDLGLLGFEIASIGRKRRVNRMAPEKRLSLLKELFESVQVEQSRR